MVLGVTFKSMKQMKKKSHLYELQGSVVFIVFATFFLYTAIIAK